MKQVIAVVKLSNFFLVGFLIILIIGFQPQFPYANAVDTTLHSTEVSNTSATPNHASETFQKEAEQLEMSGQAQLLKRDFDAALSSYSSAIQLYTRLIESDPQNTHFYHRRGKSFAAIQDYEKALEDYNRAIQLRPKNPDFYPERASSRVRLGDFNGAQEDYTRAISLNPENFHLYLDRAITRESLQNPSGAANDKAIYNLLNLAWMQETKRDYLGAIESYTKSIKIEPEIAHYYYRRAQLKRELENYQGAIEDLSKAIQLEPKTAEFYHERGESNAILTNDKRSETDFTKAIQLNSASAEAYTKSGEGVTQLNQLNIKISESYAKRAYLRLVGLRNYQGAIEDANEALEIHPNFPLAYGTRAKARGKLGDTSGAIQDFNKALELDPDNTEFKRELDFLTVGRHVSPIVSVSLCLAWIIAISLHEFGHAIIAYWGGDRSIKAKGYLTLNPLKYIHPIMSIIIPGIFFLSGGFPLPGAAVFIEYKQLKSRLWYSATFAAGPLFSILFTLFLVALFHLSLVWALPAWLSATLACFISLNFLFAVFNLLPIPPLDGYGILEPWLPFKFKKEIRFFSIPFFILFSILLVVFPRVISPVVYTAATLTSIFNVQGQFVLEGLDLFDRGHASVTMGLIGSSILIVNRHLIWEAYGDFLRWRQFGQPIAAYGRALKIKPHRESVLKKRGQLFLKLYRYDEAFSDFEQIIQRNPNNYEAWEGRYWVLRERKCHEEALANFNKLLELKPGCPIEREQPARLLEELKRYDEALLEYDKLLALRPNQIQAHQNRIELLVRLQRYEQALVASDELLACFSNDDSDKAIGWNQRGLVLDQLERHEEALATYEKSLSLNPSVPSNFSAWDGRGKLLYKLGREGEAITHFQTALEKVSESNSPIGKKRRGKILHGLKRYEEAIAIYDNALQKFPNGLFGASLWYEKAHSYARLNNKKLAIKSLEQAICRAPEKYLEDAKMEADFDGLRNQPDFQALMAGTKKCGES